MNAGDRRTNGVGSGSGAKAWAWTWGLVLGVVAGWGTVGRAWAQGTPPLRLELPAPHGGLFSTTAIPGPGGADRFAGGTGVLTTTVGGVVTAVDGGDVFLWDTTTGKIALKFGTHRATVDALQSTPDGTRLLSASSSDGAVRVWDTATGALRGSWKSADGALGVTSSARRPHVAISSDGRRVVASGATPQVVGTLTVWNAGWLEAWDVETGGRVWSMPDAGVSALAIAPGGGTVVAFTRRIEWVPEGNAVSSRVSEAHVRVWDAATGAAVSAVPVPGTNIVHLLTPAEGTEVVAVAGSRYFRIDAATGRVGLARAFPVSGTPAHVHLAADGRRLLWLELRGDRLHLVDLEAGTATLLWQGSGSLERWSVPAYSTDLGRGVGLRVNTPQVWELPFPRLTGLVASGNDLRATASVVAGGTYSLWRSGTVDGAWVPVARGTAGTDRLTLTDTNALVGVNTPWFYRVARD